MNHYFRKTAMLLIACMFFFLPDQAGFAENNQLTADTAGQIISFRVNAFIVNAPESGSLKITVSTNDTVYRIIDCYADAGKNKIEWDGLGFNQEKLYPMMYHIDVDLKGDSGNNYHYRFNSTVENCAQAMVLALPSSEVLYLDTPEEWFLECKVIRSGTLAAELIPEGCHETVTTFFKKIEPLQINHLTFTDIAGNTQIEPGRYSMRVYEISNPDYCSEFAITAELNKPDVPEVSVTGKIMPETGDSDEEIWKLMMQPAVVIDIDSLDHQHVYDSPDENSASLGTLHGQTQALQVICIQESWAMIEAWNHEEGEKVTGWVPLANLKIVYPSTEYGLLVSKKEQTITVFRHGERMETISVCTGKMLKGQLYQETAAGSFLTGEHRVDYSANGNKYDFVIQYDGGNLIHQIPYRFGKGKKDFTEGKSLLGTKASHACIRIQSDPGETEGINAYWIWTHIPYHTRVIILDDPDERHAEKEKLLNTAQQSGNSIPVPSENDDTETEKTASMNSGKESVQYSVTITDIGQQENKNGQSDETDSVVMTFGGDAVLGGQEWHYSREDSLMSYVAQYGMAYPFSGLQQYFATDDLTSVNLECVLKSDSSEEDTTKRWRFRGLPEYTGILTEGSVELVNIANNHTIDYGHSGYRTTIEAIEGVVAWCGRAHPTAVRIKGHLIGFGGCRETTFKTDHNIIAKDIRALRDVGCEYIIYQCHWGNEYDPHFNATQQTMAHLCVEAGADLVIGHHPHIVQGIDYIGDVPIIYSLGNLCFGGTIDLDKRAYDAILARVTIIFGGDHPETEIRIIPIRTSSRASEGINDFRPVPAEGSDAERILKNVQNDSAIDVPR